MKENLNNICKVKYKKTTGRNILGLLGRAKSITKVGFVIEENNNEIVLASTINMMGGTDKAEINKKKIIEITPLRKID